MTYREPNPHLGVTAQGEQRLDSVRACFIRILDVREGYLDEASEQDAKAEGYRSFYELLAVWGRPRHRIPVWVVRFVADRTHRPRLLTSRVIAGRQGAYVEVPARAMTDEPEAVDEATQKVLTAQAHERDRVRFAMARDERSTLAFEQQLPLLVAEARARHIDVRDEIRAILRWSDPAAKQRQLERIREKLEQVAA